MTALLTSPDLGGLIVLLAAVLISKHARRRS